MGVGLFRTEFFLVRHHRFPDEEIQYQAYRNVVEKMAPWPVIIRTLDVGGDKFASYLGASPEDNPFLGMRGIRFLPDHRDLFRSQCAKVSVLGIPELDGRQQRTLGERLLEADNVLV